MSDLPKAYEHKLVEKKWYSFWEKIEAFKADPKSQKEPYCIILPPPNVTGALHMGHALVDTIQDMLIRYKRMQGFEALWVPGTDHAGISTQTVVEKHLIATEGKRRVDYSREEFLEHMHAFKEKSKNKILDQLKQVGCSCDWSKLRFTMDEASNKTVKIVFKKMFDEGLIYQGDYLVNWDTITQTALADDEVEHEEKDSSLWYFRYPVIDSNESIMIATTRPETMLGDTAVAVSPDDERYKHLIGRKIKLPIVGREIPIIADHYVDKAFGTGAVKITPAHDFNDYEVGKRHDLPIINIMTPDGKINEAGKEFATLTMEQAREAIVKRMKELGFLEKVEPHKNRVGLSYRSKAVIEPFMSKQWFIKMEGFKEKLISAVKDKRVTLIPEYWEKTYFHWIENLRDWCISRQLWWGHRIPIWHNVHDPDKKICHIEEGLPKEVEENPNDWEQDPDVLDTWFSSSLWPFSVLGWPHDPELCKKFYPTSTLVTGHDILFFWVARMILMGEYIMDEIPFHESFVHGLIYGKSYWKMGLDNSVCYVQAEEREKYELGEAVPEDVYSKWEKMSKSKGNVIDPIEIIEKYGADAMRMALCSSITHARQIDLDRRRFEEYKNFANKIWNASRFIFMNIEDLTSAELQEGWDKELCTLEDRWILSLLNRTKQNITRAFDSYDFDEAANCSYQFFWDQFCAYYLEFAKPYLFAKSEIQIRKNKQKLLVHILLQSIRFMHPIIPFLTEEIFQLLKEKFPNLSIMEQDSYTRDSIEALNSTACIIAPFPMVIEEDISSQWETKFQEMDEILYQIRNIRAEMGLAPSVPISLYIQYQKEDEALALLKDNIHMLRAMVCLAQVELTDGRVELPFASSATVGQFTLTIPLPEGYREKELSRLQKEKEKLSKHIQGIEGKLNNSNFVERAPKELVEKTKLKLQEDQEKLKEIEEKLQVFI